MEQSDYIGILVLGMLLIPSILILMVLGVREWQVRSWNCPFSPFPAKVYDQWLDGGIKSFDFAAATVLGWTRDGAYNEAIYLLNNEYVYWTSENGAMWTTISRDDAARKLYRFGDGYSVGHITDSGASILHNYRVGGVFVGEETCRYCGVATNGQKGTCLHCGGTIRAGKVSVVPV